MKGLSSFLVVPAAVFLLALSGCDAGNNRTVTGEYFNRGAGTLGQTAAHIDSVVNTAYSFSTGANVLAGKYRDTSAFAVIKFAKPTSGIVTTLQEARLRFIVYDTWTEGERELGLWGTHVNWSDTTRLKSEDFLPGLGEPFATLSDTASTVTSMTFTLDEAGVQAIKAWGTTGAFLLKNTAGGNGMVNVYSNYSSSTPVLELISLSSSSSSGTDTTRITPVGMTYLFDEGIQTGTPGSRTGVVSDGGGGAFVLHISLPDSFARTSAVNSGKLVIPIARNGVPEGEVMNVSVQFLNKAFTTLSEASSASSYNLNVSINPGDSKIELDISTILGLWSAIDDSDYGLLFNSTKVSYTPAQVVLTPPDSIGFFYTTLPEVK